MKVPIPGFDKIDSIEQPICSLITEANFAGETEPHRHHKAQLLYVVSGVLTVMAAGGIWTVPPNCALWIPGGLDHAGRATGPLKISSLYLDPELAAPLNDQCGILFVQPFLRELIHRFDGQSSLAGSRAGEQVGRRAVR